MSVRLVLLDQHYRTAWEWTDDLLDGAAGRLKGWAAALPDSCDAALVRTIGERLADDLDTPGALAAVDAWAAEHPGGADDGSGVRVADAVDALLGVEL